MTLRSLVGLGLLNAAYLVVGVSLLFMIGGALSRRALLRLVGVGYLLGLATCGVVWSLMLVVGIPFGWSSIGVSMGALIVGGIVVRRHRSVDGPVADPPPEVTSSFVTATGIALAGIFLVALFRASRLHALIAYDAWAFWVPKAKALYHFGELDPELLASLPGPAYPPVLPLIDAAAFHAMGGTDVVTLHVQFWLVIVGFVVAVAGLSTGSVPPWILWPSLLGVLVAPRFTDALVVPQADVLLGVLVAVAAVLVLLWLLEGELWRLAVATSLLACAVLVKREGAILAAAVIVAALISTRVRPRRPWRPLAVSAAIVAGAAIPWRLWYVRHGLGGELPSDGASGVVTSGRLVDAFRLSIEVLFDIARWSIVTTVAVAALVLAGAWGSRRIAVFSTAALVLVVLGGAWITAAFPELPVTANEAVNPIVRYTGSAVLLSACLVPFALASVWADSRLPRGSRPPSRNRGSWPVVAVVTTALAAYLAIVLAGGAPAFPSRDECARVATSDADGELELVFGRLDSPVAAQELRDRVVAVGFVGTEVEPDGCGRWKVANDGIDSFEQGQGTIEEARRAGFDPRLEVDPGS